MTDLDFNMGICVDNDMVNLGGGGAWEGWGRQRVRFENALQSPVGRQLSEMSYPGDDF